MSYFQKRWQSKPKSPVRLNPSCPLTKGLVAAWIFNEGGGKIVQNLVNPKHNGTINGTAITWGYGVGGLGLSVGTEATGDEVACGTTSTGSREQLRSGTGLAFVVGHSGNMWANRTAPYCLEKGTEYGLVSNSSTAFTYRRNNANAESSTASPWDASYQQAGWSYPFGGTGQWSVNGLTFDTDGTTSTLPGDTASQLTLLNRTASDRLCGGVFYYIYIYDRHIQPAEMQSLYLDPYQIVQPANNFAAWLFEPSGAAPINQTVIPASVPIVGQSVTFTLTTDQTVTPATVPIVGQSVTFQLNIQQTVTPATLPIAGQSVPLTLDVQQTVSPATVPIVGQTVDFSIGITQAVSAATLPIVGQSVPLTLDIQQTVSVGTLPIVGQTVGYSLTTGIEQTVVPATVPIVGQSVPLTLNIQQAVSPASVPIVGQNVGFVIGIAQTVAPATLPIVGQSVALTLDVQQTVSPATLPIVGATLGQTLAGPLTQAVLPASLPIVGQTLTLVLKSIQGTLLDDIEEDLGATFFECSGLGFATDFVHAGTTYCGIFTAEATDISERQNPFIETETTNTSGMSRGDTIEVIATPLNAGGTFTIRGLSPDGTGQTTIILDTP